MALIEYVEPEEASPDLLDLLQSDRQQETGRYSLVTQIVANNPHICASRKEWRDAVFEVGNLDVETQEIAHITVSLEYECELCVSGHTETIVEMYGMPKDLVSIIASDELEKLDERERAVVEFARQAASDPKRVSDQHISTLRDTSFSDADIIELLATVVYAMGSNTIVEVLNVNPTDYDDDLPEFYDFGEALLNE